MVIQTCKPLQAKGHSRLKGHIPKLERVLDRSIRAFLPGLLRMDRLAREMSAVTRVMVILGRRHSSRDNRTVMVIIASDGLAEHTATGALKTALTCLQIDALKSQKVLFASYLLPGKTDQIFSAKLV